VAALMGSGIMVREWENILLLEKAEVGITSGFMFLRKDGTPAKSIFFEEALVERL
jgi:hypothetical protein